MQPPTSAQAHVAIVQSNPTVLADLQRDRQLNDLRLKTRFEDIFAKYSKDFSAVGDEIDITTGEVVLDNGHMRTMVDEGDIGDGETRKKTVKSCSDDEEDDELAGPAPTRRNIRTPRKTASNVQTPARASTSTKTRKSPTRPPPTVTSIAETAVQPLLAPPTAAATPQMTAEDIERLEKLGQTVTQTISQFLEAFQAAKRPTQSVWDAPPLPVMPSVLASNQYNIPPSAVTSRLEASPAREATPNAPSVWAVKGTRKPRERKINGRSTTTTESTTETPYSANTKRRRMGREKRGITTNEEDADLVHYHSVLSMSFKDIQKEHFSHLTASQLYHRYYYLQKYKNVEDESDVSSITTDEEVLQTSPNVDEMPSRPEESSTFVATPRLPSTVSKKRKRDDNRSSKENHAARHESQRPPIEHESLAEEVILVPTRLEIPNSSSIEDPFSQDYTEADLPASAEQFNPHNTDNDVPLEHAITVDDQPLPAQAVCELKEASDTPVTLSEPIDAINNSTDLSYRLSSPPVSDAEGLQLSIVESIESDEIKLEPPPTPAFNRTPKPDKTPRTTLRQNLSPDQLSSTKFTRSRDARPTTATTGSWRRRRGFLLSEMAAEPKSSPLSERRKLNKKRSARLIQRQASPEMEESEDELAG